MSKTGENTTTGVTTGASGSAGGEDSRWMVAADPAFYLDQPVWPVRTAGTAGGGR